MENNDKFILVASTFLILSIGLTYLLLQKIIRFSIEKNLLDIPDDRKKHKQPTPSSGGLVFGAIIILLVPFIFMQTTYGVAVCCGLLLLIVGFYDDCNDLSAKLKFLFQIIATVFTIDSIGAIELFENDIFMFNEIITFLFILGFTNAFNLIDGVDGLAGMYAVYVLIFISIIFWVGGNQLGALLTIVMMGCTIGFLKFNLHPAKIFMGDTGSLFLGFGISFLTVIAIQNKVSVMQTFSENFNLELLFLSVLALPMLDTIRVMGIRITQGRSPFKADRTHLHHLLGRIGFKPIGICLFFLGVSSSVLTGTYLLIYFQFSVLFILLSILLAIVFVFNLLIYIRIRQHKKRMISYLNALNYIIKENIQMVKTPLGFTQK